MNDEEKSPYYERAQESPSCSARKPENTWKEASRVLRNLEANVSFSIDHHLHPCDKGSVALIATFFSVFVGRAMRHPGILCCLPWSESLCGRDFARARIP